MLIKVDVQKAQVLYDGTRAAVNLTLSRPDPPWFTSGARRWFAIVPPLACPASFVYDAPFGRFGPTTKSFLVVDGACWQLLTLVYHSHASRS